MSFHIGQKIVCVNNEIIVPRAQDISGLTRGAIYTIRWIGEFPWEPDRCVGLGTRLVEINRGHESSYNPKFYDYPFALLRFRPLLERKTDISIFTSMLKPTKEFV